MKITFRQSFARDLKKLKDQAILERVKQIIAQVEAALPIFPVTNGYGLAAAVEE